MEKNIADMKSMLLYEHPAIYQIPVPNPLRTVRYTNAYVIRGSGSDLLVDTGVDSDQGLVYLWAALDELGVDLDALDVFLTHVHYDHSGLVERLGFGGKLYLGKEEIDAWSGEARQGYIARAGAITRLLGETEQEAERVVDLVAESIAPPDLAAHEVVFLRAGDRVRVGRFAFEVMELSGHSPCDIALYLPDEHILISGDVVIFDVTPAIALFDDEHDYLSGYLESLRRLRKLPVDLILPGHGVSQGDPEERIDWLLQHHEKRLAKAERLISENPGITGSAAIEGLHWNAPTRGDSERALRARSMVLVAGASYLNALVVQGRVSRETGDDGIWRFGPR